MMHLSLMALCFTVVRRITVAPIAFFIMLVFLVKQMKMQSEVIALKLLIFLKYPLNQNLPKCREKPIYIYMISGGTRF